MQSFIVGQPFPLPVESSGVIANLTTETLNFVVVIDTPTDIEISMFKTGSIRVGLYEYRNCPFMTLRFDNFIAGDCTIDAALESPEIISAFLSRENKVNSTGMMFLVDGRTRLLKAIRYISYDKMFIRRIENSITEQLRGRRIVSFSEIVSHVYDKFSLHELFRVSDKYKVHSIATTEALHATNTAHAPAHNTTAESLPVHRMCYSEELGLMNLSKMTEEETEMFKSYTEGRLVFLIDPTLPRISTGAFDLSESTFDLKQYQKELDEQIELSMIDSDGELSDAVVLVTYSYLTEILGSEDDLLHFFRQPFIEGISEIKEEVFMVHDICLTAHAIRTHIVLISQ